MEKFIKDNTNVPREFVNTFFKVKNNNLDMNEIQIDFDDAVNWLEITKGNLERNLRLIEAEKDIDYVTNKLQFFHTKGATIKTIIFISRNCFKNLCSFGPRKINKTIYKYILDVEIAAKQYKAQQKLLTKIERMKTNQKPKLKHKGGLVYIRKAMNTDDDEELYKIGVSYNIQNRNNTYESGNANDVDALYIIKTPKADRLEKCIKIALEEYQYRGNKEIYEISLKKLKRIFDKCNDAINNQ